MGYGRWDNNDWDKHATSTKGKSTSQIFNQSSIKQSMDPRGIAVRESRDSVKNPNSTPIILALDVTGSMGVIADRMAREGLGTLVEAIIDRQPVSDPHIMVMGVGDAYFDRAPLQASQFEADIRIAEQLKDIYLEKGGGGNHFESYNLPWYFAATKTDIDSVKRGKKGIIFTFGDEECPAVLEARHIKKFLGDDVPADISTKDLLKMVSAKYDVYHVVVEQGNHALSHKKEVYDSWNKVLPPDRIIALKDYNKLSEVLVSVLEVHNGKEPADVVKSWQGPTAKVVEDAISHMKPGIANNNNVPLPPKSLKLKLKP